MLPAYLNKHEAPTSGSSSVVAATESRRAAARATEGTQAPSVRANRRRRLIGWQILGNAVGLAIIALVAWHFTRVLRHAPIWDAPIRLHAGWLTLCGACYLISQCASVLFWYRLLYKLDQRPSLPASFRAFFVGQLAKYAPPRIWGLVLRGVLIEGKGVRRSVAAIAATYEALTTMAAAAVVAAGASLVVHLGGAQSMRWTHVVLTLLPLVPLYPPLFRWILQHATRSSSAEAERWQFRAPTLFAGILLIGVGWLFQGVGLWAVVKSLAPAAQSDLSLLMTSTGAVTLAYVAGFFILPSPGGLGVRELVIQQSLQAHLLGTLSIAEAAGLGAMAAILYRLVCLSAEIAAGAMLYWLPGQPQGE